MKPLLFVIFLITFTSGAIAQSGEARIPPNWNIRTPIAAPALATTPKFEIRAGQSVYVTALRTTGGPDIATERKLKQEFEKQKVFKLSSTLSAADIVFVMFVEYEHNVAFVGGIGSGSDDIKSVAVLVVPSSDYAGAKGDLDSLREDALWRDEQDNGMWRTKGVLGKMVQKFHQDLKNRF